MFPVSFCVSAVSISASFCVWITRQNCSPFLSHFACWRLPSTAEIPVSFCVWTRGARRSHANPVSFCVSQSWQSQALPAIPYSQGRPVLQRASCLILRMAEFLTFSHLNLADYDGTNSRASAIRPVCRSACLSACKHESMFAGRGSGGVCGVLGDCVASRHEGQQDYRQLGLPGSREVTCPDGRPARWRAGWQTGGFAVLVACSSAGMRDGAPYGKTGGGPVVLAPRQQAILTAVMLCGWRSCRLAERLLGRRAVSPAGWRARWMEPRPVALQAGWPPIRPGNRQFGRATCQADGCPADRTTLFLASMSACRVSSGHDYRRCEFQRRGGEIHARR